MKSLPELRHEGAECGKERGVCLGSRTGKTSRCCSPNMQGTSFVGEEHEVRASYKGVPCLRLGQPTSKELVVVHQTYNKYNKV